MDGAVSVLKRTRQCFRPPATAHKLCRTWKDDDENDRIVQLAKRTGRILGWAFVGYLIWSLGQLAKLW